MTYIGLSDLHRGIIVALLEKGMPQRQITQAVGVPQSVFRKRL